MRQIESAFAGAVITAQTFNPSTFSETWLLKSGIVAPDTLEGLRVFSPDLVQFQTADMQVLVTPPRMQITFPLMVYEQEARVPLTMAIKVVEALPHTPYLALGLNFDFFTAPPRGQGHLRIQPRSVWWR